MRLFSLTLHTFSCTMVPVRVYLRMLGEYSRMRYQRAYFSAHSARIFLHRGACACVSSYAGRIFVHEIARAIFFTHITPHAFSCTVVHVRVFLRMLGK